MPTSVTVQADWSQISALFPTCFMRRAWGLSSHVLFYLCLNVIPLTLKWQRCLVGQAGSSPQGLERRPMSHIHTPTYVHRDFSLLRSSWLLTMCTGFVQKIYGSCKNDWKCSPYHCLSPSHYAEYHCSLVVCWKTMDCLIFHKIKEETDCFSFHQDNGL